MSQRPIGIFDSGVGGLSVAREIRRALPGEHLVYVADTAHCPYGDRPAEQVRARALGIGDYLQGQGVKLVVTACNTASGAALEQLRAVLTVPVVGLEPAVKTGAAVTRNRRVGVMATAGTLASERFARLVASHGRGIQLFAQACPGLADLIEQGHLDGPTLDDRLLELTRPLREAEVDTVVLGCTHYAFVRGPLARCLGEGTALVDSAPAIARRADQLLRDGGLRGEAGTGSFRVLTTGAPQAVRPVVERLWGEAVGVDPLAL